MTSRPGRFYRLFSWRQRREAVGTLQPARPQPCLAHSLLPGLPVLSFQRRLGGDVSSPHLGVGVGVLMVKTDRGKGRHIKSYQKRGKSLFAS